MRARRLEIAWRTAQRAVLREDGVGHGRKDRRVEARLSPLIQGASESRQQVGRLGGLEGQGPGCPARRHVALGEGIEDEGRQFGGPAAGVAGPVQRLGLVHRRRIQLAIAGVDHGLQRLARQTVAADGGGQGQGRRVMADRASFERLVEHLAPPGQADLAQQGVGGRPWRTRQFLVEGVEGDDVGLAGSRPPRSGWRASGRDRPRQERYRGLRSSQETKRPAGMRRALAV
jgi:hypothetical protein